MQIGAQPPSCACTRVPLVVVLVPGLANQKHGCSGAAGGSRACLRTKRAANILVAAEWTPPARLLSAWRSAARVYRRAQIEPIASPAPTPACMPVGIMAPGGVPGTKDPGLGV